VAHHEGIFPPYLSSWVLAGKSFKFVQTGSLNVLLSRKQEKVKTRKGKFQVPGVERVSLNTET